MMINDMMKVQGDDLWLYQNLLVSAVPSLTPCSWKIKFRNQILIRIRLQLAIDQAVERSENIARVRNCPDVTLLNSLFGLFILSFCDLDFLCFCHFVILPFSSFCLFVFLSFCHFDFPSYCLLVFLLLCLFVFLSFCLRVFLSFCHFCLFV